MRTRDLLMLLIEDLQWIDAPSEALLSRLLDQGSRLMGICTYRQPYVPPWAEAKSVEVMRLKPLSASGTEALLQARLDSDALPRALVALVTEKAEGNPLFAEEIAQVLLERGVVGRQFSLAIASRAAGLDGASSTSSTSADRLRQMAARAEAIGRRLDDRWVTLKVMSALTVVENVLGWPMGGRREALRMIDYSRETGDPRGRSMGL